MGRSTGASDIFNVILVKFDVHGRRSAEIKKIYKMAAWNERLIYFQHNVRKSSSGVIDNEGKKKYLKEYS